MNKEQLIKTILNMFVGNEVMFAYYCGSIAYQTADDNSDIDVTVVLNDFKGLIHTNIGNIDFFVYGENDFIKRQKMDEDTPLYNKIHADDFLRSKENLIYLNPSYEQTYEELLKENFVDVLNKYLDAFLEYYEFLVNADEEVAKRGYHIIRVRAILENYIKTGKYDPVISNAWLEKIKYVKDNWNKEKKKAELLQEFKTNLEEIKEIRKEIGDE